MLAVNKMKNPAYRPAKTEVPIAFPFSSEVISSFSFVKLECVNTLFIVIISAKMYTPMIIKS